MEMKSLVQQDRQFTLFETAEDLAGVLEVPNHPEIATGYGYIYRGFWTSPRGERMEVAIKELRTLVPRGRQSEQEALKHKRDTVGALDYFCLISYILIRCYKADKAGSLCLEPDQAPIPSSTARLSFAAAD